MTLHKKTNQPKKTTAVSNQETETPAPPKKKVGCRKLFRRWILRILLLFIVLVIVVPAGIYILQPKYYKVLIIGSDQRGTEHARSDVLMMVAVPKSSADPFSMTMIPRDTKIDHPEKGMQKITHFYAMWEDEDEYLGNKELTQSVVEDLLDVKAHATVEVTFDSFIEIVDLLGGVDTEQGHLDGAAAKEIVHNRYVQAEGDFGRASNQREILRNILSRLKKPANAQVVYDYFQETERARIDVNMTQFGVFGLAYVVGHKGDLSLGDVEEVILPGSGQRIYTPDFNKELYYWVLDEDGTKEKVDEYLK
ncbi:MAG: LCP family protein [bacterium]|nr:LCP family protein [bacterium]